MYASYSSAALFLIVHTAVGLPGSGDTAISAGGARSGKGGNGRLLRWPERAGSQPGSCGMGEAGLQRSVCLCSQAGQGPCSNPKHSQCRARCQHDRAPCLPVTARPGRSTRSEERGPRPQAA